MPTPPAHPPPTGAQHVSGSARSSVAGGSRPQSPGPSHMFNSRPQSPQVAAAAPGKPHTSNPEAKPDKCRTGEI